MKKVQQLFKKEWEEVQNVLNPAPFPSTQVSVNIDLCLKTDVALGGRTARDISALCDITKGWLAVC